MRVSRRLCGAAIGAVLLIIGIAPVALASSEDSLLSRLNAERTSRGLAALESHWDLIDDAEAHSRLMMSEDNLHHNPNLGTVTTGWIALGENVGVGPSVDSIHNAFMGSAPHRANILGDFTHVGIGAVRESENKLWVTVVFMKANVTPPTTTSPPPTTTITPPPTSGVTTTTTTVQPPTTLPPTTQPPTTLPPTTLPPTTQAPTIVSGGSVASSSARAAVQTRHYVRLVRLHGPRPV